MLVPTPSDCADRMRWGLRDLVQLVPGTQDTSTWGSHKGWENSVWEVAHTTSLASSSRKGAHRGLSVGSKPEKMGALTWPYLRLPRDLA